MLFFLFLIIKNQIDKKIEHKIDEYINNQIDEKISLNNLRNHIKDLKLYVPHNIKQNIILNLNLLTIYSELHFLYSDFL